MSKKNNRKIRNNSPILPFFLIVFSIFLFLFGNKLTNDGKIHKPESITGKGSIVSINESNTIDNNDNTNIVKITEKSDDNIIKSNDVIKSKNTDDIKNTEINNTNLENDDLEKFEKGYIEGYNKAKKVLDNRDVDFSDGKFTIEEDETNISNFVYNNLVKKLYYNNQDSISNYKINVNEEKIKSTYFWELFTQYNNIDKS